MHDEIKDYNLQENSQDYKIELYREKIMAYEKEKQAQTNHAEALKLLTLKLNNFIDNNNKK